MGAGATSSGACLVVHTGYTSSTEILVAEEKRTPSLCSLISEGSSPDLPAENRLPVVLG